MKCKNANCTTEMSAGAPEYCPAHQVVRLGPDTLGFYRLRRATKPYGPTLKLARKPEKLQAWAVDHGFQIIGIQPQINTDKN